MAKPLRFGRAGRTFLALSSLLYVTLAAACGGESDDSEEGADEIVQLEQQAIPTQMKELRAGQGYLPGIDEAPIVGQNPCLSNAKIIARGANVTSSAAFVQTRTSLNAELGLEATAQVPVIKGFSGAASIAAKASFDSRSAVVLFQTAGTYESTVNTDAVPQNFDAASVAKCGYGYIARAQHRVAALLLVNMESSEVNGEVRGSLTAGKKDILDVKGNLAAMINRGNLKVTLRFATDAIPDLPAPPFAETSVLAVGDAQSEKQTAINKIETALTWLANANSFVQKYLLSIQTATDQNVPPPAPTEKVFFRYYPNTPADARSAVEVASKSALDTRKRMAETEAMKASWTTFVQVAKDGRGYEWNIAGEAADSVESLRAKANTLLGDEGKLQGYEDTLSQALEACTLALRNEGASADLTSNLKNGCKPPVAMPFDKTKTAIRPISIVSTSESDRACKGDSRLPNAKEAAFFKAWSSKRKADGLGGLWADDGASCGLVSGFPWINDGKVECSGNTLFAKKGLAVCVSKSTGPFPEE